MITRLLTTLLGIWINQLPIYAKGNGVRIEETHLWFVEECCCLTDSDVYIALSLTRDLNNADKKKGLEVIQKLFPCFPSVLASTCWYWSLFSSAPGQVLPNVYQLHRGNRRYSFLQLIQFTGMYYHSIPHNTNMHLKFRFILIRLKTIKRIQLLYIDIAGKPGCIFCGL